MKASSMLVSILAIWVSVTWLPAFAAADPSYPHPTTYMPTIAELYKVKAAYDDPTSLVGSRLDPRNILPPALKEVWFFDVEKMSDLWAELVGLRAPDLVGKIAPEIKPGKYTYMDLEKHPGLKDLMVPIIYDMIKPGEKPLAGNIPEFEIVPTRERFWSLPIAEASKRNMGKTEQDEQGYLIEETWEGGYPFPRPSGKFKAQQYVYNFVKRYAIYGQDSCTITTLLGFDRDLKVDLQASVQNRSMRLASRVVMDPSGWFDDRASKRGEFYATFSFFSSPRDVYGTAYSMLYYLDQDRQDQQLIYVPGLRRFRKLSSTDSQDPTLGIDQIVDDSWGFSQKISASRYPYEYEILEEREFLMPITYDGTEYMDSQSNFEWRNIRMERRPMVVILLTQKDPNYVYGKRIIYFDKETFQLRAIFNYDQKGRLYRSNVSMWHFYPEMGMSSSFFGNVMYRDHIDKHSTAGLAYYLPAFWDRSDVSMKAMAEWGK